LATSVSIASKTFCILARNIFDKLQPEPGRTRKARPNLKLLIMTLPALTRVKKTYRLHVMRWLQFLQSKRLQSSTATAHWFCIVKWTQIFSN